MSLTSLAISRANQGNRVQTPPGAQADALPSSQSTSTEKFGELVQYIPTEMVTIFLAAMSTREALAQWAGVTALGIYQICLVATPLLFLLLFAGTLKQAGKKLRKDRIPFPWWPTFATTAAFGAWGLVVPGVLPENQEFLGPVVALFATVLTILLPVIGRAVEKPRTAGDP